ncbi:MAG: hypothetical protein KF887_04350 [Paracoccaceae bacterium]|nr:MAG: hypothetical protein KF887_04350 [Paracoccaceae bacterium]
MTRYTALAAVLALVASTTASVACDPATTNDCGVTVSTQQGAGELSTGVVVAGGLAVAAIIVLTDEKDAGSH